jgi:predicted RecA/RadA family phage recombinase
MATNYVQEGNVITYTAGADISSGNVLVIGTRVGVALTDIANGDTGSVQMSGVFNVACLGTDVVTQGAVLYWDSDPGQATLTSTDNTLMGYAFAASGDGVTTVDVKLNG